MQIFYTGKGRAASFCFLAHSYCKVVYFLLKLF